MHEISNPLISSIMAVWAIIEKWINIYAFFGQAKQVLNVPEELYHGALDVKDKFFDESQDVTLQDIISEFSNLRIPAANGLADLCVEHYNDMASHTSSSFYLIQKKIEAFIFKLFPSYFIPLYTMIAFTRTPYHLAIKKSEEQNRMITKIASGLGVGMFGGITYLALKYFRK